MTRNKWLMIIIGILVASNGMLAFKNMSPKKHQRNHQHRKSPKEIIIEELNFDEAERILYEKSIVKHRTIIDEKDKEISAKKEQLFDLLAAPNDSLRIQYTTELGILKAEVEKTHFEHFLEIKSICTAEQHAAYKELTKKLGKLFSPKMPKYKR
jgi:hypothetical protein